MVWPGLLLDDSMVMPVERDPKDLLAQYQEPNREHCESITKKKFRSVRAYRISRVLRLQLFIPRSLILCADEELLEHSRIPFLVAQG